MICAHCRQPIEPVDGPGKKYSHRHTESKRILCFGAYESEIATPTEDTTMNEPLPEREFSRRVNVQIIKDEPLSRSEWMTKGFFVTMDELNTAGSDTQALEHGDEASNAYLDNLYHRYYLDRFQPYRWRAVAANNEPIAHGESYFNEADAINAAELLFGDDSTVYLQQHEKSNQLLRYGATDWKHQAEE
jgi:uncharacterized protein YegP (UPF0339 family)